MCVCVCSILLGRSARCDVSMTSLITHVLARAREREREAPGNALINVAAEICGPQMAKPVAKVSSQNNE